MRTAFPSLILACLVATSACGGAAPATPSDSGRSGASDARVGADASPARDAAIASPDAAPEPPDAAILRDASGPSDAGATLVPVGDGSFALDPYPAACAVSLIDSIETADQAAAWYCASWASATTDGAGNALPVSLTTAGATEGQDALSVPVRFTGSGYEQGWVGRHTSLSLAGCAAIALDVTLPAGAPSGLRGSLILLMGPGAAWNGQADPVPLNPGAMTTVRLPLAGGIDPVAARDLYRQVLGIGLKIDGSNVTFSGSISLDNLRTEGVAAPTPADLGAQPVGVFGGFVSDAGVDMPTRNGFSTFGADSIVQGHGLLWAMLGPSNGDFVLGRGFFGTETPSSSAPSLVFHDWSLVEAQQNVGSAGQVSALMSRAFPAVRYTSSASIFYWATAVTGRSPMSRMAIVENGQIAIHHLDSESSIPLSAMSEPWMLLWAGGASGWSFDVPTLLTFEKHPQTGRPNATGVEIDFGGAMGRVQVMPLAGLRRRTTQDTIGWDSGLPGDAIVQSRAMVPILAAFPMTLSETFTVDEAGGTVKVRDAFTHDLLTDAWATVPTPVAPLPPAVYRAGLNGYPVSYPAGAPVETAVATYFGPFAYQPGASASYTIPLAAALTREPIPLRVLDDPTTAPIRTELERMLVEDVPSAPTGWVGNDISDAEFMCDGWATFEPGSPEREKARVTGPLLAENAFLGVNVSPFAEPFTGQQFLAPAYYPEANLPFDKEWNSGRQLAGVARCSESIDLDVARGLWPKILATYRYHRIFFDWATGSVESSCLGFTELADGMHFAWDGMLGVGRLARKLGDEATWQDVAYRTARQQAALYNAWFHALWVKDIDYGIGHITNAKLANDQIETRGAIDGWVEDFGAATLEFKSFWETANTLYYDVPAQLSLYRDYGLEDRVHALEYDIMPTYHPSWTDGNTEDPVDQRYYGSNYTAAHLVARALLFHDDPATLFADYNSVRGTSVASQWYTMLWHGLAGPMLLSIERGHAPLVEAPIASIRLARSSYDAATGAVSLDFQALQSGPAVFRTRRPGGTFSGTSVNLSAGQRYLLTFVP